MAGAEQGRLRLAAWITLYALGGTPILAALLHALLERRDGLFWATLICGPMLLSDLTELLPQHWLYRTDVSLSSLSSRLGKWLNLMGLRALAFGPPVMFFLAGTGVSLTAAWFAALFTVCLALGLLYARRQVEVDAVPASRRVSQAPQLRR
jgi:hypothetical protein